MQHWKYNQAVQASVASMTYPKMFFLILLYSKEGAMFSNEVNAVSTKYAQKSNIIYFTAHPSGPMKKFELQDNLPSSLG